MLPKEDRDYHLQRARAELDLAYRADRSLVANAHMKLSALHMDRLRELDKVDHGSGSEPAR